MGIPISRLWPGAVQGARSGLPASTGIADTLRRQQHYLGGRLKYETTIPLPVGLTLTEASAATPLVVRFRVPPWTWWIRVGLFGKSTFEYAYVQRASIDDAGATAEGFRHGGLLQRNYDAWKDSTWVWCDSPATAAANDGRECVDMTDVGAGTPDGDWHTVTLDVWLEAGGTTATLYQLHILALPPQGNATETMS